jgi:glycosyltransferase involved in cell wall biosynthesis
MKRIAVFSMAPVFPDVVHGGSQKTLAAILEGLSQAGHECKVFCTWRPDNAESFSPFPNVDICPFLKFKSTYPEPHYTAPYHLAALISLLTAEVNKADVLYIHDSELLFSQVFRHTPTVFGVQDLVYPDTLAGVFAFERDHLVVPSEFMRDCLLKTVGRCTSLTENSITLAPNGFSTDRPASAARKRQLLRRSIRLSADAIPLLYPHRPDPRKGLIECVHIVKHLRRLLPQSLRQRLRLLVPIWVDSRVATNSGHVYQTLYSEAAATASELGMPRLLHFHPWLRQRDMAAYYELGAATMCIGNFIESFGNVSIESQLVGTPALVSRVAAQRTILPEELTWKCDFGDSAAAAEILARVIRDKTAVSRGLIPYVRARYGEDRMKQQYVRAIEKTAISRVRRTKPPNTKPMLALRASIPPWCAPLQAGYYNDYTYGYCVDAALLAVVKHLRAGPLKVDRLASMSGCGPAELAEWNADGHIWLE